MSTTIAITYVLFGKLLGPARVVVAQARDSDRARPIAVVKGSATATKIETKLPAAPRRDVRAAGGSKKYLAGSRALTPARE